MTTPFPFTTGQVLTAAQMNAITTLPINDQTASYTLVVGDVGKRVIMNNAGATTITVNNSVFGVGDTIFIANKGAGTSTVTAGAGVTINTADSLALAQYQSGSLVALSASSFLFFPSTETIPSITSGSATVATDQNTSSTSFTDLATVGPEVTLTTGTQVLVIYGCNMSNGSTEFSRVDFAISGATTRSASSTTNAAARIFASANTRFMAATRVTVTAGSNTFTMKYAVGGSSTDFANRELIVISLN